MNRLAPNLFDRRYDDLVELGRSQLPALAPEWTDHNAHDPGITFLELLAWVAEAQLYSLGRVRRDERTAYAGLMGVGRHGTRPAKGLIWADRADPSSPAATFVGSRVIETEAPVRLEKHDEPTFHPQRKTLWVPGRIVRLSSRSAGGTVRDLTASNERGTVFLPFGEGAGIGRLLDLEFELHGEAGLFPKRRQEAEGACWAVGVRAADGNEAGGENGPSRCHPDEILVTLVAGGNRYPLKLAEDSTAGLLRTGALVLDLSGVKESPGKLHLEIRAPRGFARPPRWTRIEPGVLPITQRLEVEREGYDANGQPDFELQLDVPGLCFEPDAGPLRVEVLTGAEFEPWTRCDRLSDQGPEDRVYELDAARGSMRFGNGINGRRPAAGAPVYVSYSVSGGAAGNVASNRKWTVLGFGGVFGVNPDAIAGGEGASGWVELRREARRHAKEDHALVTAADIESAARALPLLGVARAWVVSASRRALQTGTVTLIAMRDRPPETPWWLDALRRRLARGIPLGTRLVVAGPRYAEFSLRADVEVEAGRDPDQVREAVTERLKEALALIPSSSTAKPREPGVPVTRADVAAWILSSDGVERVSSLTLFSGGKAVEKIGVPRGGLPRVDLAGSTIRAFRPTRGSGA